MIQSVDFAFPDVEVLTAYRYSVPPHGPEYSGTLEWILSMPSKTESTLLQIHWTGLFLPWHRWYVHIFEESLKNKCGYTGVSPYWNWTIGHPGFSPSRLDSDDCIDAQDFYKSSFWKDSDPVSGLGGWGDPNDDFRVPDGGFHKLPLSYPTPHTVRRNFTLLSFNLPFRSFLITDRQEMGNSSFTASIIEAILEIPAGDYKGFQTVLEAPEVRAINISNMGQVSSF